MFTALAIEFLFNNGLKQKLPPWQFPLVNIALLGAGCINANVLFVLFIEKGHLNQRQTGRRREEMMCGNKVKEQGLKVRSLKRAL